MNYMHPKVLRYPQISITVSYPTILQVLRTAHLVVSYSFKLEKSYLYFQTRKKIDVTYILEGNERAHLMERRRERLLVT